MGGLLVCCLPFLSFPFPSLALPTRQAAPLLWACGVREDIRKRASRRQREGKRGESSAWEQLRLVYKSFTVYLALLQRKITINLMYPEEQIAHATVQT